MAIPPAVGAVASAIATAAPDPPPPPPPPPVVSSHMRLALGLAHLHELRQAGSVFACDTLAQLAEPEHSPVHLYMMSQTNVTGRKNEEQYTSYTKQLLRRMGEHNTSPGRKSTKHACGRWELIAAIFLEPTRQYNLGNVLSLWKTGFRKKSRRIIGALVLARLLQTKVWLATSLMHVTDWINDDPQADTLASFLAACCEQAGNSQLVFSYDMAPGRVMFLVPHALIDEYWAGELVKWSVSLNKEMPDFHNDTISYYYEQADASSSSSDQQQQRQKATQVEGETSASCAGTVD